MTTVAAWNLFIIAALCFLQLFDDDGREYRLKNIALTILNVGAGIVNLTTTSPLVQLAVCFLLASWCLVTLYYVYTAEYASSGYDGTRSREEQRRRDFLARGASLLFGWTVVSSVLQIASILTVV